MSGPGRLGAGALLALVVLRVRWLRHDDTRAEAALHLPGDDVVGGRWRSTHGVTITARPEDVWPWLVQVGWGRGGWYSVDALERLVGAGTFAEGGSARRVVPELQHLAVGDEVPLSAAGGLTVLTLQAPHTLVLGMDMDVRTGAPAATGARHVLRWTWAFVLREVAPGRTRLVVRVRADDRATWVRPALALLVEPVHVVMERVMLRTLAQRVEQAS